MNDRYTSQRNELKEHVDRLKKLLDDPHPGLSTWVHAYGQEVNWLMDFWGEPPEQPQPEAVRL
jgi:hypothetical protein